MASIQFQPTVLANQASVRTALVNAYTTTACIKEFPAPAKLILPEIQPGEVDETSKPCTLAVPPMPNMLQRHTADGMDMTNILMEMNMYGRTRHVLGRRWQYARPRISWGESSGWGQERLILEPAVAGTAAPIADRNTVAAMQAAASFFPTVHGSTEFGSLMRAAVARMADQPMNPVRYVWRLAVCWVTAAHLERLNKRAVVAPEGMPSTETVLDLSNFVSLVGRSNRLDNYIIHRPTGMLDGELAYSQVYALAGCVSPGWTETDLPSVAHVWPTINNVHFVRVGAPGNVNVGGHVSASVIWSAAMSWCRAYSTIPIFMECVEAVCALWYSPSGGDSIYQHDKVRYALPAADMYSMVLAPLARKYIDSEMETISPVQPDIRMLLAVGAQRALALGVGVMSVGLLSQLPALMVQSAMGVDVSGMHELGMWCPKRSMSPAVASAAKLLAAVGITGDVGRILGRVGFGNPDFSGLSAWYARHAINYQWEELLPSLDVLPSHCALHGATRPLKPLTSVVPRYWYAASKVPDARCIEEAYHSVARVTPDVEVAYAVTVWGTQSTVVYPVAVQASYRGVPSDWLFTSRLRNRYMGVESVFRFTTVAGCVSAAYGDIAAATAKWYMVDAIDTSSLADSEFRGPGDPQPHDPSGDLGGRPPNAFSAPQQVSYDTGGDVGPDGPPPVSGVPGELAKPPAKGGVVQPGGAKSALEIKISAVGDSLRKHLGDKTPPWVDDALLLAKARTGVDAESVSAAQGLSRKVVDGWLATPLYETLLEVPMGERSHCARMMHNVISVVDGRIPASEMARQILNNKLQWGAAASALHYNDALKDDELVATFKTSPEVIQASRAIVEPRVCVTAGTPLNEVLGSVVHAMKRTVALAPGIKARLQAEDQARARVDKALAESHEAGLQMAEDALREWYEQGVVDRAGVIEALNAEPSWLAPPEVAVGDIASTSASAVPEGAGGAGEEFQTPDPGAESDYRSSDEHPFGSPPSGGKGKRPLTPQPAAGVDDTIVDPLEAGHQVVGLVDDKAVGQSAFHEGSGNLGFGQQSIRQGFPAWLDRQGSAWGFGTTGSSMPVSPPEQQPSGAAPEATSVQNTIHQLEFVAVEPILPGSAGASGSGSAPSM
ncbi:putative coat protein [viral metagenome]|uniref:Putative coat protein n=1 Tax=viral metagenome TaxID=1070528 RepID=A0A6L2ZK30_9ZZZZ